MPEKERKYVGKTDFVKGLEGAITHESTLSYVDGQNGKLIYRGYSIDDLCRGGGGYEETAYLLLKGKLPTRRELDAFKADLSKRRGVPKEVKDLISLVAKGTHPMNTLRSAVSLLGCLDPKEFEVNVENDMRIALDLTAQFPTLVAAIARVRRSQPILDPDPSLGHSADFLRMMTGKKPDERTAEVMDMALIIHAEHGMNASTFSAMVVNSTLTDLYSSVTAGIGALKGPLHGGANEQTLRTFMEIKDPNTVDTWFKKAKERKVKVPGFGHRVYKAYDPRARIFDPIAKEFSERGGHGHLYQIAKKLEALVVADLGGKGIFPNVDYFSGVIYDAMGIDSAIFTPIFAVPRIAGWCASILEYLPENRLFRPTSIYVGELEAEYVSIEKRK
ncbi:MAG: citrate synthase/methylcitrate synthase [Candidatus Tectomicrobia bacterium]|uniref:Citrate synthase n=1 Tax=Tectimicrobiota bacterium TaxID=2528274 RepID=A0A932HXF1_UNCTE|nr:citrate synthase/methylcitrate synthase [Candidatus Tectomicrobia bacterium]